MFAITIKRKEPGTRDRQVVFRVGVKYALVCAAHYGRKGYSSHRSAASVADSYRATDGYDRTILGADGCEYLCDGYNLYRKDAPPHPRSEYVKLDAEQSVRRCSKLRRSISHWTTNERIGEIVFECDALATSQGVTLNVDAVDKMLTDYRDDLRAEAGISQDEYRDE